LASVGRGTSILEKNFLLNIFDLRRFELKINGLIISSTDMKKSKTDKPPSEEYQRFEELAKQLISVPKSELDKREAEYQRQKKHAKKKRVA